LKWMDYECYKNFVRLSKIIDFYYFTDTVIDNTYMEFTMRSGEF
jgi:hypothetical protein